MNLLSRLLKGFAKLSGAGLSSWRVFRIKAVNGDQLATGSNFRIGKQANIHLNSPDSKFSAGDDFFLDDYTTLNCSGTTVIGHRARIGESVKIYDHYRTKITIGDDFLFEAFSTINTHATTSCIEIGNHVNFRKYCNIQLFDGRISIGNSVFFNNYCSLNCLGEISIGENTIMGEGVKVYDHNHKYQDIKVPIRRQGFSIGKVSIGSNCWIGSNTVILNNVTIGDNVVIGANNLIFKNIASGSIIKSLQNQDIKGPF